MCKVYGYYGDAQFGLNTVYQVINQRLPVLLHEKLVLHHLNVSWQAMVYEICTMEFSFDLRWFHGTLCSYVYCILELF